MAQHPHLGIEGSKPRLPQGNGETSKAAVARLSAEYLAARNRQMAFKAALAEMELQRRGGQLIARYDARVQLGFLLTGLRQRLMSFAFALPRRLVNKTEHEIGRLLDAEVRSALKDIATWPERMATPGWCNQVDVDLVPPPEAAGNGGASAELERKNAKRRQKYAKAKEA